MTLVTNEHVELSFPLIIDLSMLNVSAMHDKLFRLCNERQLDSSIMSQATDIINRCKFFGVSFFLLVEKDDEGGYTVKETRLVEQGAEFLRSCERV